MEYIKVGTITNTHGIKGEVRIKSDFKYKEQVFLAGNSLYLGQSHEENTINTHRIHKNLDMVTFTGINDINEVLKWKGSPVYIHKNSLTDAILEDDLVGLSVYMNEEYIGEVTDVMNNPAQDIFVIKNEDKEYLVPYVDEFVESIDIPNKKLVIIYQKGLIE